MSSSEAESTAEREADDSSDEEINHVSDNEDIDLVWFRDVLDVAKLQFSGQSGLQMDIQHKGDNIDPIDVYKTIINEDVINLMVLETNRYAAQLLASKRLSRSSRLSRWRNTNNEEMEKFIGEFVVVVFL